DGIGREAGVKREAGNLLRMQVAGPAGSKSVWCDGGVDIVENFDRLAGANNLLGGSDSFREERTQDGDVAIGEFAMHRRQYGAPIIEQTYFTEIGSGQVAIGRVPLLILLKEDDAMLA